MEKQTFTVEQVERILAGRQVVETAGIFPKPITISNVSLGKKNPDGTIEPFFYNDFETGQPDYTRPYGIVNLQAMTNEEFEKAVAYFEDEDFEKAISRRDGEGAQNLSINLPIEEIQKMNLTRGGIVTATFDYRLNKDDEEVIVCTAVAPVIAKAGKNAFADRLRKIKADAKSKAQAETESANQENA